MTKKSVEVDIIGRILISIYYLKKIGEQISFSSLEPENNMNVFFSITAGTMQTSSLQ